MNKKKFIGIISIIILLLIIGLMIYFIINKNLNRVVCSSNATNNGISIKQEYIIQKAKESVVAIEVNKSYSFEDNDQFKTFGTVIENTKISMDEITNKYITFKTSTGKNKYTTKLNVDMSDITKDELSILGLNKDLTKLKDSLVNQGLTCK